MFREWSRVFRGLAALVAGVLLCAGLIGITSVATTTPAGAAVVDDQPVSGVASPMWQTNNTVWALDVQNNVVYAGGSFTQVRPPGVAVGGAGSVTRNRIAAFNATTGDLITAFNPNANGQVYDVDVSPNGQYLYVAGSFTTIGGQTRQRIARLNLPSGTVDTAWQANANAIVATVISDNNNVYVGGDFTTIKNTARQRIAKLNATNGNVVTAFTANADKRVGESALAPNGSRLIMGGELDTTNGTVTPGVVSLNPTTGAMMPWAANGIMPRPTVGGCNGITQDIIISGTIAYVTAEGEEPGCWEGYYAANIADGSLVYNEHCLGGSVGLAIANGWMYRASHNHDCSKQRGRLRRPEQRQRLHLVPARGPPSLRRPARPLEPDHQRWLARDHHDRRPAGHRDRRHEHLHRRRLQHRQPAEPAGPRPVHAGRREHHARGARPPRGSPPPRPARSRSASRASATTTTARSR